MAVKKERTGSWHVFAETFNDNMCSEKRQWWKPLSLAASFCGGDRSRGRRGWMVRKEGCDRHGDRCKDKERSDDKKNQKREEEGWSSEASRGWNERGEKEDPIEVAVFEK